MTQTKAIHSENQKKRRDLSVVQGSSPCPTKQTEAVRVQGAPTASLPLQTKWEGFVLIFQRVTDDKLPTGLLQFR